MFILRAIFGRDRRGRRSDRNRIFTWDNLRQILLVVVGGLVAWSVSNPYVIPQLDRGPTCTRLPNPPGGNQRSLLAGTETQQKLKLEVRIANERPLDSDEAIITTTDDLEVIVIFTNTDDSPLYLYYFEGQERIQSVKEVADANRMGLYFEISSVEVNPRLATEGQGIPQNIGVFEFEDLYVLQGRRSCHVRVILPAERVRLALSNGGAPSIGDFRIRAHYRNDHPGNNPNEPGATATAHPLASPVTGTQGVWTGHTRSPEVRFRIEA
jgi:hypothetical protein